MELNFEELDAPNQDAQIQDAPTSEVNYINYWSNANQTSTTKKPKVSYDDILSSLNMVVHNGVLQFAKPTQQSQQKPQQKTQQSQQKKQVTINAPQPQQNNYITNKYFKDYKDESQGLVEEPRKPMTKEEYKKMLIQDYINRQNAIRRISQIKSKKLLFNTQNISIAPNNNPRDLNKLFSTFRK